MKNKFDIFAKPVVTFQGLVMVVRSNESKWRFPSIQISSKDEIDRRVTKGLKDLTGLEVEPFQFLDPVNVSENREESIIELFIHVESEEKQFELSKDVEAKWVEANKLAEYLRKDERKKLERKRISNFIDKLTRMPSKGGV